MSASGSSSSRPHPPPPPGGNLGVAEEDRIEVEHVRPQPPPVLPATSAMLPYHHRSRNNDDPDFQTTTLTRPLPAEGPAGVFLIFREMRFCFGGKFKCVHISGANSSSRTGSVPAIDLHHHHGGHLVHHPAHVRPPHHELRR